MLLCKGRWVLCCWEAKHHAQGLAGISLFPLFQPSRWKEQRKKVVLRARGGPAHSKIPACKCSWQLLKTGKCICVNSRFPGEVQGGMKGRSLASCLSHGQAAPPWEQAAGSGSAPGSACCQPEEPDRAPVLHETLLPGAGLLLVPAKAASQAPRRGCSALGRAPGEGHYGSTATVIAEEHPSPGLVTRSDCESQSHILHPATAHQ